MKTTLMMILGLSLNTLLAQAADEDTKPKPTPPPALPESVKKYDKNGDGKIDEAERQAIMEERKKEREEIIKKRQAELGKEPQKKIEEKK